MLDGYALKNIYAKGDKEKEREFHAWLRAEKRKVLESIADDLTNQDLRSEGPFLRPSLATQAVWAKDANFIRKQAQALYPKASWENG